MALQIVKDSWLNEEFLLETVAPGDVITLSDGSTGIVTRVGLGDAFNGEKPGHKVYFTERKPIMFKWRTLEGQEKKCWWGVDFRGEDPMNARLLSIKGIRRKS